MASIQMKKVVRHLINPKNWVHSGIFKLKDNPTRHTVYIDVVAMFGFSPKFISVTKVQGKNNSFVVSAELPEETIKEREKIIKKLMLDTRKRKDEKDEMPDLTKLVFGGAG